MVNPNRFYTYAYLREDRTPYYVGKGSGNRIKYRQRSDIKPPKDKSRIIFLKQNLTEEEAFKHEKYMIVVFGRKNLGTGILHNKTDGGDGSSGAVRSEYHRRKITQSNKTRTISTETKRKQSNSNKGKNKGKKWWNDGCGNSKMSVECPGEGWVIGVSENHKQKLRVSNKNPKTKEKMNIAKKGKKWWYDGNGNTIFAIECPDNWYPGKGGGYKKKGDPTNLQKWMCLKTGFITNPGNLTKYQRARGIDTSKRKRIE